MTRGTDQFRAERLKSLERSSWSLSSSRTVEPKAWLNSWRQKDQPCQGQEEHCRVNLQELQNALCQFKNTQLFCEGEVWHKKVEQLVEQVDHFTLIKFHLMTQEKAKELKNF